MKKANLHHSQIETKRQPHFSLRKLNVGLASVLIGTSIYLSNNDLQRVQAATISNDPSETEVEKSDVNNKKSKQTENSKQDQQNVVTDPDITKDQTKEPEQVEIVKPVDNSTNTQETAKQPAPVNNNKENTGNVDDTNNVSDTSTTKPVDNKPQDDTSSDTNTKPDNDKPVDSSESTTNNTNNQNVNNGSNSTPTTSGSHDIPVIVEGGNDNTSSNRLQSRGNGLTPKNIDDDINSLPQDNAEYIFFDTDLGTTISGSPTLIPTAGLQNIKDYVAYYQTDTNPYHYDGYGMGEKDNTSGRQIVILYFSHQTKVLTNEVDTVFTVNFVAADTHAQLAPSEQHTAHLVRSSIYDLVLGKVTSVYKWAFSTSLPPVINPVVKGYVAHWDKETQDDLKSVLAGWPDTGQTGVILSMPYERIGKVIPVGSNGAVFEGVSQPLYDNNTTHASKAVFPTLPTINGYTPLTPKMGNPWEDTKVVYVKNNNSIVQFMDKDNHNSIIPGFSYPHFSGKYGEQATKPADLVDMIKQIQAKGYTLVDDPFASNVTYGEGTQAFNFGFSHTHKNVTQSKTWTQTVHFVDKDGKQVAKDVVQTVTATQKGDQDQVTNETTWDNNWVTDKQPTDIKVPVVNGYFADSATVKAGSFDPDKNDENTVTYTKLGQMVPVDKNGNEITGAKHVTYVNDPNDPTKILTQTAPDIAGWTINDKTVTPKDLAKDTKVTYLKNNSTTIKFYDEDSKTYIDGVKDVTTTAEIGKAISKPADLQTVLDDLAKKGYVVSTDPFSKTITATDGDQVIQYGFKHKLDDATDTTTWTQYVSFTDEDGKTLHEPNVQKITGHRTGKKDAITGNTVWGDWKFDSAASDVKVPVIDGYISDDTVIKGQPVVAGADQTLYVKYHKLGHLVPVDSSGKVISGAPQQVYANDPNDPTKILASQKVPTVDGYTPKVSTVSPKDPLKDEQVVYIKNNQTTISFVDQDNSNKAIDGVSPVTTTAKVGDVLTKPASIADIIKSLQDKGYELVTDPFSKDNVATEGQQNLQYVFKHKHSTVYNDVKWTQTVQFVDDTGNKLADDNSQSITTSNEGDKDLVTGKIVWSDKWINRDTIKDVKVPVVNGYLAEKGTVAPSEIVPNKDATVKIVYHKLGHIIPVDSSKKVIPNAPQPTYKNDPTDASKVTETDVPVIDGYEVRNKTMTPSDPLADQQVVFLKKNKTVISFIDQDTGKKIPGFDDIVEENTVYDQVKRPKNMDDIIKQIVAKGYTLVTDPINKMIQAAEGEQNFQCIFKHTVKDVSETINWTQTIHFVDESNNKLADDNVQTIKATHTGTQDLATGKITWNDDWTYDTDVKEVTVPIVKGYIDDYAYIKPSKITPNKNVETNVVYRKLGHFIPVDSAGNVIQGVEPTVYQNDPVFANRIAAKQVPNSIDGYTLYNDVYEKPINVADPYKDTKVTFLKNNKTIMRFIDKYTGKEIDGFPETVNSYKFRDTIPFPTDILDKLYSKHYLLDKNPMTSLTSVEEGEQYFDFIFSHNTTKTSRYLPWTQTTHFVDENGKQLADDNVQTLYFTETGVVDDVTQEITWNHDYKFVNNLTDVKPPVIDGYLAEKGVVPPTTDIALGKDVERTVAYHKLGHLIPVDSNGNELPNATHPIYQNDPKDANKIGAQTPPAIAGYAPKDATINPSDPLADTKVVYLKNNSTVIHFVDQDNDNKAIDSVEPVTTTGKVGEALAKPDSIADILAKLDKLGYELVTDPFEVSLIAKEGSQDVNYVFKHKIKDVTQSTTWTQTTHFKDSNGKQLAEDDVQTIKATQTGKQDEVTNKTVWNNDWTYDKKPTSVKVPVVKGYIAKVSSLDPSEITIGKDAERVVTYQKLGSYIPVDNKGKAIANSKPIQYENDPDDATKVKTDQELPTFPSYTTPKAPVPADLTKDTEVTYHNAESSMNVVVHDDDTKTDLDKFAWSSGKVNVGDKVTYDWAKVKQALIDAGYEIVSEPTIPDKYAETPQTVTIHVKHKTFEFDPDNPPKDNGTVKWPAESEYKRTYKRIIHLVDSTGRSVAKDIEQTIVFKRHLKVDAATGKILNPDAEWIPEQKEFAEIKVPTIPGYAYQSKTKSGTTIVNGKLPSSVATTKDIEDSIIYVMETHDNPNEHQEMPIIHHDDNDSNGSNGSDSNDPNGSGSTNHKKHKSNKHKSNKHGVNSHKTNKHDNKYGKGSHTNGKNNRDNGHGNYGNGQGSLNNAWNGNSNGANSVNGNDPSLNSKVPAANIDARNLPNDLRGRLPQTGRKSDNELSVIGLALALVGLGLTTSLRRKKDDEK